MFYFNIKHEYKLQGALNVHQTAKFRFINPADLHDLSK